MRKTTACERSRFDYEDIERAPDEDGLGGGLCNSGPPLSVATISKGQGYETEELSSWRNGASVGSVREYDYRYRSDCHQG